MSCAHCVVSCLRTLSVRTLWLARLRRWLPCRWSSLRRLRCWSWLIRRMCWARRLILVTRSSTLERSDKLHDLARHVVMPDGIVSTGWTAVRDTLGLLGIRFDPWQQGAGQLILSKDADGYYACTVGGVTMSIPRQVGKTFMIGWIVFALCIIHPGLTVTWS